MNTENTFPLGTIKANLELQLHIAQLMQEAGQRWIDMSSRIAQEGIEECKCELMDLNGTKNWQTLAVLPAEAFWRQLQKRFVDTQTATQFAIEARAEFTKGLQKALQDWQKATGSNVSTSAEKLPFLDFVKSWGGNWAVVTPDKKGGSRAS